MLGDIGERLLGDAVEDRAVFGRQAAVVAFDAKLHGNAAALGVGLHVPAQCGGQAKIVELRGTQVRDQVAQFAQCVLAKRSAVP